MTHLLAYINIWIMLLLRRIAGPSAYASTTAQSCDTHGVGGNRLGGKSLEDVRVAEIDAVACPSDGARLLFSYQHLANESWRA